MATNDDPWMQKKLEAPMPLIGMYVAFASLACSLLISADLLHAFRSKKLWFPSYFFSLNATSLALLSVALKLPVDLTTSMTALTDRLAKISSLSLLSTSIANFLPSLGSMSDSDILLNVTALTILILTVVADVCIQVVGTRSFLHHRVLFPEEILALSLMLLLLLILVSTSIMVLTTKKCLEAKYHEKHTFASTAAAPDLGVEKLRNFVNKYWVMAETSCPQFVIARSSSCAAAGVICVANALTLAQAIVRTGMARRSLSLTNSSYGCSTEWILLVQTIGVIFGTISTSFRWFTAVRFRCSAKSLAREFRVEDYWTRKLLEIQASPIHPFITNHKCRRLVYNARGFVVNIILRAQMLIVLFNKLVLVISCCILGSVINIFQQLNTDSGASRDILQNVRPNSLRLEGEADFPDYMLQSIPKQMDEVLEASRRKKPCRLIELLRGSTFKGVAELESLGVPSIHGKEPKSCWSLAVVTLTSIAVAIPNVEKSKVDQLVEDVRDGLFFVKIVEETFYSDEEWKNIRKAGDLWLRVDLFRKWQEIDLADICLSSPNSKHALQKLARESEKIASGLKTDVPDCPMFNPWNWKPRIIAANAMYRISSTVLEGYCDEEKAMGDEEVFVQLSRMIADVLAACVTNLRRVIVNKCHVKAIEERERSVRQAALLLGRSEEILDFLADRDLPAGLSELSAPYIEEWRGAMLLEMEMMSSDAITPSCIGTASSEGRGSCSSSGAVMLMEHLKRSFPPRNLEF
ncbi:uncharacterized protein LOC125210305 [Salvia hispanica]|uniref:uncharacterized protein LOC125210305 n=1 Tax=Salvia hispanica TaxID=49212 RepID=UPI002009DB42|nr:uncharacterized protein LOC125210305 [Salvia hispanica]